VNVWANLSVMKGWEVLRQLLARIYHCVAELLSWERCPPADVRIAALAGTYIHAVLPESVPVVLESRGANLPLNEHH
jgi:hypothetical protein